jgi:hypothetical protein
MRIPISSWRLSAPVLAANDLDLTYWDNNGQFGVLITTH